MIVFNDPTTRQATSAPRRERTPRALCHVHHRLTSWLTAPCSGPPPADHVAELIVFNDPTKRSAGQAAPPRAKRVGAVGPRGVKGAEDDDESTRITPQMMAEVEALGTDYGNDRASTRLLR